MSFFIILILFSFSSYSQNLFQKTFNAESKHILKTTDSKYLITGTHENQMLLLKTNSDGESIWAKKYGNDSFKGGLYSQETFDGGYVLCGCGEGETVSACRIEIIKTDSSGNIEWNKEYGGPPFSTFISRQIKQTSDLGFILVGETGAPGIGNNLYVLKTNNIGDTLWSRKYGSAYGSKGYGIGQTSDDGYIIAGQITDSTDNYFINALVVKINSYGDTIWTTSFGGISDDYAYSAIELEDGYIVGGITYSFGAGQSDMFLCKLSLEGLPLWFKTYGGDLWELFNDMKITSDGGYIIAGSSDSYCDENTVRNIFVIKTNETGDIEWSRVFGNDGYNEAYSIENETGFGYLIAGNKNSEMYIVKTDLNGYSGCNDQLIEIETSNEEVNLYSIELTKSFRGIIDTPIISVQNCDIADSIFCFVVGSEEIEYNSKDVIISPNPSTGIFEIHLKNKSQGFVSILDFSGNELNRIFINQQEFKLNISNLKPGIYFIRINEKYHKIIKI